MEQTLENCDYGMKDLNVEIFMKKKNNAIRSNKCYHCYNAYSRASNLKRHLKTHSGEKQNKCNQCDFAFSEADDLRRHLKIHSGEKSN